MAISFDVEAMVRGTIVIVTSGMLPWVSNCSVNVNWTILWRPSSLFAVAVTKTGVIWQVVLFLLSLIKIAKQGHGASIELGS